MVSRGPPKLRVADALSTTCLSQLQILSWSGHAYQAKLLEMKRLIETQDTIVLPLMCHIVSQPLSEERIFFEGIEKAGFGFQENSTGYGCSDSSEIRTLTSTVRCGEEGNPVGCTTDRAVSWVVGSIDQCLW